MVAEQPRFGADAEPEGTASGSSEPPSSSVLAHSAPPSEASCPSADDLPVMTWRSDAMGRRTHVNRAWQDFTGRDLLQELSSGWLDRLHPADRDRCLHAQAEALAKQCPFMIEYRLLRHDGTWRWLRDEARPNTIEGRFAGHVGACVDVTDLRAALARHTDAEAHAEREMLRAELRHRVKNNIQSTISFLALQARRTRDAAAAEALRSAATRVLLASQVQDRRFHGAEDSAIPLLEELETAARAAMESASRPGIAFALDPGSAALVVPPGQAASLALLLNELMMNALRHAFPDGRHGEIRLALRRLGDRRAELRLRDDGIGIPAPIRERLPRHTLGLHLASRLARQARGRLHLEGPPGTVAVVVFAVE